MSVTRIASRYAKSLLDLAIEQGTVNRVLEDVNHLQAVAKNRDFAMMLKSPIIHADKKRGVMQAIFGAKFDTTMMSFVNIVINKGREAFLPDIANEFEAQYRALNQISSVTITTATPLEAADIEAIKAKIIASGVSGVNLNIIAKVDPKIIGGYQLEFGDRLYDASIAHKLDELRKGFSGNQYQKQF